MVYLLALLGLVVATIIVPVLAPFFVAAVIVLGAAVMWTVILLVGSALTDS